MGAFGNSETTSTEDLRKLVIVFLHMLYVVDILCNPINLSGGQRTEQQLY